jgi:hypothetical protein
MEEKNETVVTPKRRPSDVEVFLQLLPNIVGSFATKHQDARTVRDLAIGLARETTLALVALGVCDRTTMLNDGQPLATATPGVVGAPRDPMLGNNNGHGTQGAMVAHWPNTGVQKIQGL